MSNYIFYHDRIPFPSQTLYFQDLSDLEVKVLLELSRYRSRYGTACPSQITLAGKLGVTREWVGKVIKKLCELGYLQKYYRHLKTSIYELNEQLKQQSVISMLARKLRMMALFSIELLLSNRTSNSSLPDEFTQSNITKVNNYIFKQQQQAQLTHSCAHVRTREGNALASNLSVVKKEKEKIMFADSLSYLRDLSNKFPLTEHGLINLAVFPKQALEYAVVSGGINPKAYDPYKYFISSCLRYCKSNNIEVSYQRYHQVREQLKIAETDAYLDLDALKKIYEEQTTKKTHKGESPSEYNKERERHEAHARKADEELTARIRKELREKNGYDEKGCPRRETMERYTIPYLGFTPSWAVKQLFEQGKLPDCPEVRKRIAENTNSPLYEQKSIL